MSLDREQTWLRRGIAVLVVLAVALLGVTAYGVARDVEARQEASLRAERTLAQLETLAGRLDRQADQLAEDADEADRARAQFRSAALEILAELGVESAAFDQPTTDDPQPRGGTGGGGGAHDDPAPDRQGHDGPPPPDRDPEPSPDPSDEPSSLVDDVEDLLPEEPPWPPASAESPAASSSGSRTNRPCWSPPSWRSPTWSAWTRTRSSSSALR